MSCNCNARPTHTAVTAVNISTSMGLGTTQSQALCSICAYSPPDVRLRSLDELIVELDAFVNEKKATRDQKLQSLRRAINELADIPAYQYCVPFDFRCGQCEYELPCCGITDLIPQLSAGCTNCWEDIPDWHIDCGKLVVPETVNGRGRLIILAHNAYTPPQTNVAYVEKVGCEYQIYIKGQPELPSSGFIRICGQDFFYRCKQGYEFPEMAQITQDKYSIVIDSTEGVTLGFRDDILTVIRDFSGLGRVYPCGYHTVLYCHLVDNCGKMIDEASLLQFAPDGVVDFTIGYTAQQYADLLTSIASSWLYKALISSCTSEKDLQRFAGFQDFYEKEIARIKSKLPRLRKAKIISYNGFKTIYGPDGRSGYREGRYSWDWRYR